MEWHFLDHAAGGPARPEVVEAMVPLLADGYGNPSGGHALARRARAELDDARERIAAVAGCGPGELVFTSGGTEADDLAVRGTVATGDGVAVCSAVEHPAVLQPVERAGGRVVAVDARGRIDLDRLADALDPAVALVSVILVNNEVGTVQSLAEVAGVVRASAPQALLHTDASQALSWLDLRTWAAEADLITLASHKCGGPKGIGALVVREPARITAQVVGGGQERGRRAGTPNVAAAVGFAVGAERAAAERDELCGRSARWRAGLVAAVRSAVPGAVDTAAPDVASPGGSGPQDARLDHLVPGIVHLCVPEVDSESVLFLLEQDHRVLAAAGSSCSSGAATVGAVPLALGLDPALARGAVRLSFGWSTTDLDVEAATVGLPEVARRLRAHASHGAPA